MRRKTLHSLCGENLNTVFSSSTVDCFCLVSFHGPVDSRLIRLNVFVVNLSTKREKECEISMISVVVTLTLTLPTILC